MRSESRRPAVDPRPETSLSMYVEESQRRLFEEKTRRVHNQTEVTWEESCVEEVCAVVST